jgi:hypothetical protein
MGTRRWSRAGCYQGIPVRGGIAGDDAINPERGHGQHALSESTSLSIG